MQKFIIITIIINLLTINSYANMKSDDLPQFIDWNDGAKSFPQLYSNVLVYSYRAKRFIAAPAVKKYMEETIRNRKIEIYWILVSRFSSFVPEYLDSYNKYYKDNFDECSYTIFYLSAQKSLFDKTIFDGLQDSSIPIKMRLAVLDILKKNPDYLLNPSYIVLFDKLRMNCNGKISEEINLFFDNYSKKITKIMSTEKNKDKLGINVKVIIDLIGTTATIPLGSFHGLKKSDLLSLQIKKIGTAYIRIETVKLFSSKVSFIKGSSAEVISELRHEKAKINRVENNWQRKLDKSCPGLDQNNTTQELLIALNHWAKSWSSQNIDSYFSCYSPTFKPSKGLSLQQWKYLRKQRLNKKYITVETVNPKVQFRSCHQAVINFEQHYQSDTYQDKSNKQLVFIKKDKEWLIIKEEENND